MHRLVKCSIMVKITSIFLLVLSTVFLGCGDTSNNSKNDSNDNNYPVETFYVCEGGSGDLPEESICETAWDISDVERIYNWSSQNADDDRIGPGDTIYLMDDGGEHTGTLIILRSGTSDTHITFAAYPGDSPQVDGEDHALLIRGKSYINIRDIIFKNTTSSVALVRTYSTDARNIAITGSQFTGGGAHGVRVNCQTEDKGYSISNVVISDCIISNNVENGISIEGTWDTNTVTVSGCTIINSNTGRYDRQGISVYTTHNVYTSGWTQNVGTVFYRPESNEPYKIYHHDDHVELTEIDGATTTVGADEWDWESGTLYINIETDPEGDIVRVFHGKVSKVIVENNTITATSGARSGSDGSGITFDFGTEDCIARYNHISNNDGNGIAFIFSRGPQAYYNRIYDNGQAPGNKMGIKANRHTTNALIYNNTVVGNDAYGIGALNRIDTMTLRNNIVVGCGLVGVVDDGSGSSFSENYNQLHNNTVDRLNIGAGAHSHSGDPLFVDARTHNYRLQQNSPCVDTGTNVGLSEDIDGNSVPQGLGPDRGAYEDVSIR